MKRGSSGLSLVVGVDKPRGMTSHDVVSACRRIFGERRVGHTGTLDPLATGAMLICVGPATRLDAYLAADDKRYRARIALGVRTDTDDALGQPLAVAAPPDACTDPVFAQEALARFLGPSKQLPPVYSALKVGGKKACDEARAGRVIELSPRDIEVFEARLVRIATAAELRREGEELPGAAASCELFWDVDFHVSKGTYIRALARDLGCALGCPASLAALRRTSSGRLSLEDCVTLEVLADLRERAALDVVALLGLRFSYVEGDQACAVINGGRLSRSTPLFERCRPHASASLCFCTSGVYDSARDPEPGERVAVVVDNRLAAIYEYRAAERSFAPRCVFSEGVSRGNFL